MNPPRRLLWWPLLASVSCLQIVLAISGRWTTRHSLSFPVFALAIFVLHPVMNRKLPILSVDILRWWRIYVGVGLLAVCNLIELNF